MLKREREEASDRQTGRSNGFKVQRTSEPPERSATDPMHTVSQDVSASGGTVNFPSRRTRQRSVSVPRSERNGAYYDNNSRVELYKDGKRIKPSKMPLELHESELVIVRVPVECISWSNKQVSGRCVFGTDFYTYDTDVVCMLVHGGYINPGDGLLKASFHEAVVTIEFTAGLPQYLSTFRHGLRSRLWGPLTNDGCTVKIKSCVLLGKNGHEIEAKPRDSVTDLEPTFKRTKSDRSISTRSAASHSDRRLKYCAEVNVIYSKANDVWLRYGMHMIADKGLKPHQLTTARLHSEALYLENHHQRFEVSMEDRPAPGALPEPGKEQTFRIAECKKFFPVTKMIKLGVPADEDDNIVVIAKNLQWDEFQFNSEGVYIQGKMYKVIRMQWVCCTVQPSAPVPQMIGTEVEPDVGAATLSDLKAEPALETT